LSIEKIPVLIQYNKRDPPDAMPIEEINAALNIHNSPYFEASAVLGKGVYESLKALARKVRADLNKQFNEINR
jgi:mutual gliding-motility protein MglA